MNRIILPLVAVALLFVSCDKSKSEIPDPFEGYKGLYNLVSVQNNVAMDPFNVAYRLNIYLNAIKNNPSNAQSLRTKFFEGAEISTKDNETYTLKYTFPTQMPVNDLWRNGTVIINTHGQDLSAPNAIWEVTTDSDNPYILSINDYGVLEQRLEAGKYQITTVSENRWEVNANEMYIRMISMGLFSLWNVSVFVEQTKGGQVPDLANAEFKIETNPAVVNGGKTLYSSRIHYATLSPVLYAAACKYLSKAGGQEQIVVMDSYDLVGTDTIKYDRGRELICNPSYTITAKVDGKETTRYYRD